MRALLISTYDLGRQPVGLASPTAWLRGAGVEVECVDTSRDALTDAQIGAAGLIGFYLPMHTATRLAAPLIARVRQVNPSARLAAYGLYATLNALWLADRGVQHVFGPEAEGDLVALAQSQATDPRGLKPALYANRAADGLRAKSEDPRPALAAQTREPSVRSREPDAVSREPSAGSGDSSAASRERGAESREPGAASREPGPESREPRAESRNPRAGSYEAGARRLRFISPDRSSLPPLSRYAALQMPDGSRRVAGSTSSTYGCKHLCRHCPIVPVYGGMFRAIPLDVVLEDVRAQVAAGAQHISFGDPDFLNGPTHARRLLERFAREFPGVTYDVTIKIEHILRHADMLGLLCDTGCLMVTSAVESVDDEVLLKLRKGHTRDDFIAAARACRQARVTLSPTFVPFTPWTTIEGYRDLLEQVESLDLVEAVAPIQLAIRLLVTAESKLLEVPEVSDLVAPFDAESLTYPWRHTDPHVDDLQRAIMQIVATGSGASRSTVFERIWAETRGPRPRRGRPNGVLSPYMTEGWYCCAEPGPEQLDLV